MYGCCYGCFSQKFASHHQMVQAILVWRNCLGILQSRKVLSRCDRSYRGHASGNEIKWRTKIWTFIHQLQPVSFRASSITFNSKKPFGHLYSYSSFILSDSHMATNKWVVSRGGYTLLSTYDLLVFHWGEGVFWDPQIWTWEKKLEVWIWGGILGHLDLDFEKKILKFGFLGGGGILGH